MVAPVLSNRPGPNSQTRDNRPDNQCLWEIYDYLKSLQNPSQSVLVDAATITPDGLQGTSFYLLFTAGIGNTRAIANPINLTDQELYLFIFDQDATGGRSVNSWGNLFFFSGAVAPTFTVAASKRDILLFRYDAANSRLDHLAIRQNL